MTQEKKLFAIAIGIQEPCFFSKFR